MRPKHRRAISERGIALASVAVGIMGKRLVIGETVLPTETLAQCVGSALAIAGHCDQLLEIDDAKKTGVGPYQIRREPRHDNDPAPGYRVVQLQPGGKPSVTVERFATYGEAEAWIEAQNGGKP